MVSLTLPNVITIALISVLAVAAVNYASSATGINIPGLTK